MADRFASFTRRVDRCARALELTGPDADRFAHVAGPPLKAEIMVAARAAFGTDLRPWNGKAVRASTGYDVVQARNGVRLEFKLRPAGVWVFGEQGSKPHLIGGGRNYKRGAGYQARRNSARNVRYLAAAGYKHPVQAPILHPGHRGRRAIRYAFKRFRNAQADAARAGVTAVIRQATR
jgi:hypothetical protein